MPAFYRAEIVEFIATSVSEITGLLSTAYARGGFEHQRTSQTLSWASDVAQLQEMFLDLTRVIPNANAWNILLEFPIPRKEKRIDVVILAGDIIFILELKSSLQGIESTRQAEEYALLLHYFHHPSDRRKIVPCVVSPQASKISQNAQQFLPIIEAPAYWISPVVHLGWQQITAYIQPFVSKHSSNAIDPTLWDNGEYWPVPSIIEAALALQSGLDIREIAHSKAARHDVDRLTKFVNQVIEEARANRTYAICFVTGVPGSGKTLVGLNLAFGTKPGQEPIHFMSGNGPLVMVLQAVLAQNQQRSAGLRAHEARLHAKTLLENVHVFAKTYAGDQEDRAPSNQVIIFDEAQRAWDRDQNFNKFKRDYSEPEMLIKIMERHRDWAVVIALVGGGQEINSGEAGLAEWGRSLANAAKPWMVFASPEALDGGDSVAGSRLLQTSVDHKVTTYKEAQLHLDVSVRSLKAELYSAWVNHVIDGDASAAAALKKDDPFPVWITRSLPDLRLLLRENSLGMSRCGLVASSRASRLRAEGLESDSNFHGSYRWDHWYLAPSTDVRSSYQLEVFATEFEIQGLELDWIGLCWGGDFIWSPQRGEWVIRKLRQAETSKWIEVKAERQRVYRLNAYRVLLTRARQGIVIYVPQGDDKDPTRRSEEFENTSNFLLACGAQPATSSDLAATTLTAESLFD